MSQELQLGKYEFYPYEFDRNNTLTLEDLVERLEKRKTNEFRQSVRHHAARDEQRNRSYAKTPK